MNVIYDTDKVRFRDLILNLKSGGRTTNIYFINYENIF